jgi:selenocysteine lyase/cysteine desulfurase
MMINPHSHIVIGEQIDILKSKIADLEQKLTQSYMDLNNQSLKLNVTEDALEFYAHPYGYGSTWDNTNTGHKMIDKGKVAREALNKIRGEV